MPNWKFQYHSLRFVWGSVGGVARYPRQGLPRPGPVSLRDCGRDNPPGAGRSAYSWNDHSTAIWTWVLACAAAVAPMAFGSATHFGAMALCWPTRRSTFITATTRSIRAVGCSPPGASWVAAIGNAWRRTGSPRLLAESVDRQGVTNEQSIYYQLYNFEAYRAAAERLRACGMGVPWGVSGASTG